MSSQLLETIKEQVEALTPTEKSELVRHLVAQLELGEEARTATVKSSNEEIRRRRLEWLKAHREQYAGEYVALDGDVLVGHGATIAEAREQAKQKGVRSPFLFRMTSEKEVLFGGW